MKVRVINLTQGGAEGHGGSGAAGGTAGEPGVSGDGIRRGRCAASVALTQMMM